MIDNQVTHNPDGTTTIIVTQHNGARHEVIMDTFTYNLYRPHLHVGRMRKGSKSYYARTYYHAKLIELHRLIMLPHLHVGDVVDHLDGNSLRNTRDNLVVTSQKRNMLNTFKNRHRHKQPRLVVPKPRPLSDAELAALPKKAA